MKKNVLFTLMMSLACLISLAQWQTQNERDYYYTGRFLGIGTGQPLCGLSVVNDSSHISYNENTVIAGFQRIYENSVANFQIYGYPNTSEIIPYMRSSIMLYSTGDAKNFKICSNARGATLQFLVDGWNTDTSERMRIDAHGRVGIATSAPKTRLQVAKGDIYISDIEHGIIMKSPDGQCWKGTMNNEGSLRFFPIDCPELNPVAITEVNDEKPLNARFYPNPAGDVLNIEIDNLNREILFLNIYSAEGRLIIHKLIESQHSEIHLSGYSNGIYVIKLINQKGVEVLSDKFVKEN
jgi:hypothetical protein